ncbi:MAG: hypothetical protein HFF08_03895 [Oscillospiraceae bacterium]|nr:hypothetical protein [Oscillospiraceae bacterium]
MVYVLNHEGKPLMPTTRYGHVRRLLKTGQAKVKYGNPFTIQLCYKTEDKVQPVILGIDPGRTNIGLCAVTDDGTALFAAKIITRNKDIPRLMRKRKQFRQKHRQVKRRLKRRRRAKKNNTILKTGILQRHLTGYSKDKCVTVHDIRNKQSRFSNRCRSPNWLTPTANQLLQTHINAVNKISKYLPVSGISIELNKFAMMKLDDSTIFGKDFQNGPLKGYGKDIHQAVSDIQDGKCLLCGKSIAEYHHVRTRSKDGSNTIGNLVGLCHECHKKVHTDESVKQQLATVNSGFRTKYDALGVLNQILPYVINILRRKYPLHITTGYETSRVRKTANLLKDHHVDAHLIAISGLNVKRIITIDHCYAIKQFRRHDRQACKREMLNRRYYLGNQLVATNRHKAFEQTTDSLADYITNGGRADHLTVKHITRAMTDKKRFMPGCQAGNKTILKRAEGNYWFDDGSKTTCKKTLINKRNAGLVFVSNL